MKRAQFVAAVVCAVVAAIQAVLSIAEGRWWLFWMWAGIMVACFVWAFCAAVRTIRAGKA